MLRESFLPHLSQLHTSMSPPTTDSDAAVHPPGVEGRWVARLRHVSVNQVEVRDAPAIISTRISFSIPRIESANLWEGQKVVGGGDLRHYQKNKIK